MKKETPTKLKRSVGRPPVYTTMPEAILSPPEAIARAIMQRPPKKEWRYLKGRKDKENGPD